jgi:hypothetical protein
MIAHIQSYSVRSLLGGCDFTPCDQVASSLFNHALQLSALGRDEEAIAAYDELIARLADPLTTFSIIGRFHDYRER